jgi:hypothetical protein
VISLPEYPTNVAGGLGGTRSLEQLEQVYLT